MKLLEWIKENRVTRERLAADLDVTYASVCFWIEEKYTPTSKHIRKIEIYTKGKVTEGDFPKREKKLAQKPKKSL